MHRRAAPRHNPPACPQAFEVETAQMRDLGFHGPNLVGLHQAA
jgi:hypothetical protein